MVLDALTGGARRRDAEPRSHVSDAMGAFVQHAVTKPVTFINHSTWLAGRTVDHLLDLWSLTKLFTIYGCSH